ncbi:MAG: virulence factor [Actinomycetota bacterium]
MARRRGNASALTTIFWRDIPAQVTASANGETAKVMLEPRFQHAIDRAAAVADLTETEAYVAQWRRVSTPLEQDPKETAARTAETLSTQYPRERLEQLVAQGGAETDTA